MQLAKKRQEELGSDNVGDVKSDAPSNALTMTIVGTKLYCAPEIMNRQPCECA